ncbi:LysR family transcriptional regulator [Pectobacterium punjabense]|uniref:LysR family transcriptional regulator n=1 Tax=Pectobacterium punjabense TaxID=2108399 RepID=UPI00380AC95D
MISSERLNNIRAFVQAVQAGGFGRAADQLGLSRSTVGKAIARLEARLQIKLFHRTTRSLSLTDEGVLFYEDCVKALAALEEAENRLAARTVIPSGNLRVTLPERFGQRWIMPELLRLTHRFPALHIDVQFSNRLVDLAEEGMDFAIRIGEIGEHTGLIARRMGEQRQVLCASADYLAQSGHPQQLSDLATHQGIGLLRNGQAQPWKVENVKGGSQCVLPPTRLRLGNMDAVMMAALSGHGIAQLPQWLVADALRRGELVDVLAGCCGAGLPIHMVWLKGLTMPLRLRAALDSLLAAFTPHAPWE